MYMSMTPALIITMLTSIAGSSAIFAFLQFLIERRDRRNSEYKEIRNDIKGINNRVDNLTAQIKRTDAVNARTRILRSSDELRRNVKHSSEFYDQLNEDITLYERYCRENRDFVNNKAANAIDYINEAYRKALRQNDFL